MKKKIHQEEMNDLIRMRMRRKGSESEAGRKGMKEEEGKRSFSRHSSRC